MSSPLRHLHTVRNVTIILLTLALTGASALAQTITRATTAFAAPAGSAFTPLTSVSFGNGTFVALGLKGRPVGPNPSSISVHTSPDGNVWTERIIPLADVSINNHGVVRFIGGQFIFTGRAFGTGAGATSTSYVARSADGVAWTITNPANLPPLGGFAEIVTGADTSVGFFGTVLSSSTDSGATWTARSAPGVTATTPLLLESVVRCACSFAMRLAPSRFGVGRVADG